MHLMDVKQKKSILIKKYFIQQLNGGFKEVHRIGELDLLCLFILINYCPTDE